MIKVRKMIPINRPSSHYYEVIQDDLVLVVCEGINAKNAAEIYASVLNKTLAEPKQEPAAWFTEDYREDKSATTYSKKVADRWLEKGWPVTPLYTSPPPREPLTPDRTMELANETAGKYWMDEAHIQRLRAAIESEHGIGEV